MRWTWLTVLGAYLWLWAFSVVHAQTFEVPPRYLSEWGGSGSAPGQFRDPWDVAVSPGGLIYVADTNNNRIQKFAADGTLLGTWGTQGTGNGQFRGVAGVAVDAAGNVFATDWGNYRVQKFDANGAFLGKWGTQGTGDGQFGRPNDVTVDAAGSVYVTDGGNNRVQKFTSAGVFVRKWGAEGSGPGQFSFPWGVATDFQGFVYVSDLSNRRIQKFDGDGNFVAAWGTRGFGDGEFLGAYGIACDSDDHIWVIDRYLHRIYKYDPSGVLLASWGSLGTGRGQFREPQGLAVSAQGELYVADSANQRIQHFSYGDLAGVFGDDGVHSTLCLAAGNQATYNLVAITGPLAANGVTGAEFRIEVSRPAGYLFGYSPPPNAFATGSPFDLTPADSTDTAGVTLLFSSCEPPGLRVAGDRVSLGTIQVINLEGAPTELRVKRKQPPEPPGTLCPRLYLCDAPIFSRVCMAVPGGETVVFRTTINGQNCAPRPPRPAPTGLTVAWNSFNWVEAHWDAPAQYVPARYALYRSVDGGEFTLLGFNIEGTTSQDTQPAIGLLAYQVVALDSTLHESLPSEPASIENVPAFTPETLQLDTREVGDDGAAGPISTTQVLDTHHTIRITVQGTSSLWPAAAWTMPGNVVCGFPDTSPQTPSPGASNGWVGLDAEILFAAPMLADSSCAGYPRHVGRFEIDVGAGFTHLEPEGGAPTYSAPDHRYHYLVQGLGSAAQFRWVDEVTSDDYGVLTITVERVMVTDISAPRALCNRMLLPNIPDPFNPSTAIRYALVSTDVIRLDIYDVHGRLVRHLYAGSQAPGSHIIRWDGVGDTGARAPSGVYYVHLQTREVHETEKLVLVK